MQRRCRFRIFPKDQQRYRIGIQCNINPGDQVVIAGVTILRKMNSRQALLRALSRLATLMRELSTDLRRDDLYRDDNVFGKQFSANCGQMRESASQKPI